MYRLISTRSARLMLGVALGLGAAAPWAGAKEKTIELDRVPKKIRVEIEAHTKGGSHLTVIQVVEEEGRPGEDWFVRWESADAKQMVLRISPKGKILSEG